MRIGIDARFWNESGVGRYVRNLLLAISAQNKSHDYVLFMRSQDITQAKKLLHGSFQYIATDIRWHTLSEQIKFPGILKKADIDLVHFPYFSLPVFYDKPYVVTIHDLILHHFPTGEASQLPFFIYSGKLLGYKFIMQQSARKAEKILTVSEATKDEIVDHLHVRDGKVVVTYEGVDVAFHQEVDDKPIIAGDYFLHVGNVYPHKNMDKLLKAFQLFIRDRMRGKLVLVGKQDYFFTRLVNRIRELDLGGNIVFLGEVSDRDLANLYRNADALISPSLMEGFDLPTVEALSHNCLVVASDISVHREILKTAAIYFDPFDINDIAAKLMLVYTQSKEKTKEKQNDGQMLVKAFSWEKMAKETINVYESCARL